MKEFVYHISEEEKDILILNKVISQTDTFVIFTKNKKSVFNLINLFKKYTISFNYLLESFSYTPLKNFAEGKSKVIIISDDYLKKNIYIPETSQIIHYDIPDHPVTYNERISIVKHQNHIKYIHLYCLEKEYQNLKAIEIFNDRKIPIGKIHKNEVKLPLKPVVELSSRGKIHKKPGRGKIYPAKKVKTQIQDTPKQEEKLSLWKRFLNYVKKLWNFK